MVPRSPASFAACVAVLAILASVMPPWSSATAAASTHDVRVGSKRFTESYVLGEIVRQTLVAHGLVAVHKAGLGNTGILVAALEAGEIDVYPEYTGTILREILKRETDVAGAASTTSSTASSLEALNTLLAPRKLKVAIPLGFSNTYALAMREDVAAQRGITSISDLANVGKTRDLKPGLSNEFLARQDGWRAVAGAYGIALSSPSGLDHGLAYDALAAGRVDLIDIYSTDARIGRDGVRVLIDDRHFFPAYDAVLLMRSDVDPAPLAGLAGTIDNRTMIALNGAAELDHRPFAEVAKDFVDGRTKSAAPDSKSGTSDETHRSAWTRFAAASIGPDFWRLLLQHIVLVGGSVSAAVIVGVPLGVWASRRPVAGRVILAVVGILQTVPSLALLALLIAVLGTIGTVPALVALFFYGLLPIVANTHAGLRGVARGIGQAATALGLTDRQRLIYVELPLAAPTLVTGVRTAAVINVGTATMAAFVGAGGFGERITAGLALNDAPTMLAGAVPAAVLALIVQLAFDGLAWLADPVRRHRR